MTDWREKLMQKAEIVQNNGWGYVKMTISNGGRRINFEVNLTEHQEDMGEVVEQG